MEQPKDDHPQFGPGFEGFPKRLPDDCVEYSLFVIDAKLKNNRERLARLEIVRKKSQQMVAALLEDFIWQRESFNLTVENKNGHIYLHGQTNYGDSVDDEWLIVYLLQQLSIQFSDLWVQTVDTDGESLLIEAANALPTWLNPEVADNRVWINEGHLKLIPLKKDTSTTRKSKLHESRALTRDEALKIISTDSTAAVNSPMIQAEAFYRLKDYPSQISKSLHHAIATLPRKLAFILHELPTSIAPAVEAFYLRDPISVKALQKATSSDLLFPPVELKDVSVKFTRVIYAQLKAQDLDSTIDLKAGHVTEDNAKSMTRQLDRMDLGMKIAAGFEMLIKDPKNKDDKRVREIKILLEDLETGDVTLPTDEEISAWANADREDDEAWLEINYQDFEDQLSGKRDPSAKDGPVVFGPEKPPGFGDPKTEADLKKIVERFESFLNDDDAGLDGAEIDPMDVDDDDDSDDVSDDEEDREVSFDEEEFERMMKEMMGMPTAKDEARLGLATNGKQKIEELYSDDEDSEDEQQEIRKVMREMEAELNGAGALDLDPKPKKPAALKGKGVQKQDASTSIKSAIDQDEDDEESDDDDEVDIDYNLAKNLLESFKSQGGMSGPAGNILASLGIQLPRDTDDERRK